MSVNSTTPLSTTPLLGADAQIPVYEAAESDNRTCTICISDITSTESAAFLACKHAFHPDCIGKWLARNETCPNCKALLKDSNIEILQSDATSASVVARRAIGISEFIRPYESQSQSDRSRTLCARLFGFICLALLLSAAGTFAAGDNTSGIGCAFGSGVALIFAIRALPCRR